MKIKTRVFSFSLTIPVIFTVLTLILSVVVFFTVQREISGHHEARAKAMEKIYSDYQRRTLSYAEMIASSRDVRDGVESASRHFVTKVIGPLYESLSVDIITVHEHDGYVIAKGHHPTQFGENEARVSYVKAAFEGRINSEITRVEGEYALVSTVPITSSNSGGNPYSGSVTVGYFMNEAFAERFSDLTGMEIIFTENGKPLASTMDLEPVLKDSGGLISSDSRHFIIGTDWYDLKYISLPFVSVEEEVGMLIAEENTLARLAPILILAVSMLTIAIVTLIVIRRALRFGDELATPITDTAAHAARVAGGDLEVEPLDIEREDEIGTLASSYNIMLDNLKSMVRKDKERREYLEQQVDKLRYVMDSASAGDFSVTFDIDTDDEIARIGHSLNRMIADIRDLRMEDTERREYLERSVREMLEVINSAAQGELDVSFDVRRDDEIGRIGAALNKMIADLRDLIENEKKRQRDMERKVRQLLDGIRTAAAGDLYVRFPADESDEFGRIGAALNSMMSDLKKKIQQIEDLKLNDTRQRELLEHHVNRILDSVAQATLGNLTVRLDDTDHDTINDLVINLNTMFENLCEMIARVQASASKVEKNCKELNNSTQSLEEGALDQRAVVKSTTDSVDNMAASIARMAGHAQDVLKLSDRATDEAREGGETAEQAIQGMKSVQTAMGDLQEEMKQLELSAEEIDQIVRVIDEISDQTNLLALNAGIEAARAGDAGRGFAVVARQVGSLAQSSSDSTKEITKLVRGIQERVRRASRTADVGSSRVQEGADLVYRTGTALRRIVEAIDGASEIIRETVTMLDGQKNDSEIILSAVRNVNRISEKSARRIEEAADSVESLFSLAKELESMVSQFNISSNGRPAALSDMPRIMRIDHREPERNRISI